MLQTRFRLCAFVGLAFSMACSGKDEGPPLESGGDVSSGAGGPSANGGASATSGGNPSGGSNLGNAGGALSGGNSSAGGSPNGAVTSAGNASGGASVGGAATSGTGSGGTSSGGKSSGGSSAGGASSGGKSSGGSSAGGAGSGGKSSGGASSGGGSGGKSSGGASGSGGSSACPEGTSQLCGMAAQHNQARANVNPVPSTPLPAMSWDTTVAVAAQAWADQCNFSHNAAGYGQNLYASAGGGPPSPTAVVTSWASEVAEYNYSANTCSGTCGHYTQVVWRSSTKVGCALKSCSTNSPFGAQFPNWYLVVCNYSPAGNNGSRPY